MTETPNAPAEDFNALAGELMGLLKEANTLASDLEAKLEAAEGEKKELNEKVGRLEGEKITLQKVASEQVYLDSDRLRGAMKVLGEAGFLPEGRSEKIAAECESNPNRLVDIIHKISAPLSCLDKQGFGVEKPANLTSEDDPDGWSKVAEEAE